MTPAELIDHLRTGSYTAATAAFGDGPPDSRDAPIIDWIERGEVPNDETLLAEALTCAAWLGRTGVMTYLLDRGVDPARGTTGTGTDAMSWAANRGQLDALRMLIARGAPLETRNAWNGTPLGMAIWTLCNEPRADEATMLAVIDTLLGAGARVEPNMYPTGRAEIDARLERHRAQRGE